MAGEPWCFWPAVLAEMTDRQILDLYWGPAVERAESLRGGSDATPDALEAAVAADPLARGELPVEVFVAQMAARWPDMPEDHWRDLHARMRADHDADPAPGPAATSGGSAAPGR